MIIGLEGTWRCTGAGVTDAVVQLPGTLDTNGVGHMDMPTSKDPNAADLNQRLDVRPIATRLTRRHTFEGAVTFSRHVHSVCQPDERVFLEVERARCITLTINGEQIAAYLPSSLSTPHVFEVTGKLTGDDEISLISDNSYPDMPHDAIVGSSAATDETQTNWNGALGYIRLRTEPETFIETVRVYPHGNTVDVHVDMSSIQGCLGEISMISNVLVDSLCESVRVETGRSELVFRGLQLRDDVKRWDEYEGNLQHLTVQFAPDMSSSAPTSTAASAMVRAKTVAKTVAFGVRDFGADSHGRLAINGRAFFLRGEANCAEFPETGFPPMSVEEWAQILETYKSYGVNVMRFHSHCPPDEAFTAADRIGMMMQPELSQWDPTHALEADKSFACYRKEIEQTVKFLANHPSFVMLTLGNELACDEAGHQRMGELVNLARSLDDTRLYASASNAHYGAQGPVGENDFYTSQAYHDDDLRACFADMKGYLNHEYPNTRHNYAKAISHIRQDGYNMPVFGFEVGQYEVLPDLREIDDFHGVTDPANYRIIRDRVHERGLDDVWDAYVNATGEMSLLCYREEVEAAMRTGSFSGLSLLGLQDFPGQGTALVGMMDAHLHPKRYGFADPSRFQAFFADQLPLVLLDRYTYTADEILTADVAVANYGKTPLVGEVRFVLTGDGVHIEDALPWACCPAGELTAVGTFAIPLDSVRGNRRLNLTVCIDGVSNSYPIWVYASATPHRPDNVFEARRLDEEALRVLDQGGVVYLSPESTSEALPTSIQTQFSPDFWSLGTFPTQSGAMGQFIDTSHPIFRTFPTSDHTEWQWWPMASSRAIVLPERYESIIEEMDSYALLRPMTQLLECRCGNGRLLLSSLGLQDLQQYPEARALQAAIYRYLASDEFRPYQSIDADVISTLVR